VQAGDLNQKSLIDNLTSIYSRTKEVNVEQGTTKAEGGNAELI
jgi:hypothetical protein